MRISEALALQWDDIDFRRRVIRVYRSAKREGEGSTKSKRFRAVQVGPRLLDTLRDLRARSAEAHPDGLPRVLVFTMPVRIRQGERAAGARANGSHRWIATPCRAIGTSAPSRRRACGTCRCTRCVTRPPRRGS
jgi:integrase